jgi:hypothetical protein
MDTARLNSGSRFRQRRNILWSFMNELDSTFLLHKYNSKKLRIILQLLKKKNYCSILKSLDSVYFKTRGKLRAVPNN